MAGTERGLDSSRVAAARERCRPGDRGRRDRGCRRRGPGGHVGRSPTGQDRHRHAVGPCRRDASQPAQCAASERDDRRRRGVARALGQGAVEIAHDEQPPRACSQPPDRPDRGAPLEHRLRASRPGRPGSSCDVDSGQDRRAGRRAGRSARPEAVGLGSTPWAMDSAFRSRAAGSAWRAQADQGRARGVPRAAALRRRLRRSGRRRSTGVLSCRAEGTSTSGPRRLERTAATMPVPCATSRIGSARESLQHS